MSTNEDRPWGPLPRTETEAGHAALVVCPVRGCRWATRVEDVVKQTSWTRNKRTGYPKSRVRALIGGPTPSCPEHRSIGRSFVIEGRVAEWVRCDGRCTAARSATCSCSCGGTNHGSAYRPGAGFTQRTNGNPHEDSMF